MKNLLYYTTLAALAGGLAQQSLSNGGFTAYVDIATASEIGLDEGGYKTWEPEPVGYVVSWPGQEHQIKCDGSLEFELLKYLLWLKSHLPLPVCVGGWRDTVTGIFYLDLNTIVATPKEAEELAVRWGQIAYYDLADGKEIRV